MRVTLSVFASLIFLNLNAQISLSGHIREKSGEPLLGVNVFIEGTYDGATTDPDGRFVINTEVTDSIVLVARFIGFHDYKVEIDPLNLSELEIELKEKINKLDAVVISAGSFDASDERRQVVLKALDIVTTAGATADIPGALNTLPGTQTVGETGRLFVRGGEGRETKTFIDGMIVHNEYSPSAPNTPGRSRFSPFMFKGMSFSTGGYSAEYGQALSSALILKSKDLAELTRTDFSFMSVGADVGHTSVWKNSSFSGKVQYTNLTPYFKLVSQKIKWEKAPTDYNGNFAYRIKTSKTGLLKFYSNLSTSDMDLYERDIADPDQLLPTKVSNDYFHFNTSYREILSNKLGINLGISITESMDFASQDGQSRGEDISGRHGKVVLDYQYSDKLAIKFGSETLIRNGDERLINDVGEELDGSFNEVVNAGFAEVESYLSSSLVFKTGVRVETNSLINATHLTPRISAGYKLSERSQVSLAYGSFYQAPTNSVIYRLNTARSESARHYIANYQWLGDGRSFRIEAYKKKYDGLTRYQNIYSSETFRFDGEGFAEGIDVFWRDSRSVKNTDYWVSYSYLNSKRKYRNYPGSFRPPFVSNHNLSIVVKRYVQSIKSQLGFTYSFASRRKYNNPNGDVFLSSKTPNYHDLSFNISYLYSNHVIVHAMVNNVFGFNNIFGYEYTDEPNSEGFYDGRAITPPAKRFLFLGIFITLAKNKSISQLPNL